MKRYVGYISWFEPRSWIFSVTSLEILTHVDVDFKFLSERGHLRNSISECDLRQLEHVLCAV